MPYCPILMDRHMIWITMNGINKSGIILSAVFILPSVHPRAIVQKISPDIKRAVAMEKT